MDQNSIVKEEVVQSFGLPNVRALTFNLRLEVARQDELTEEFVQIWGKFLWFAISGPCHLQEEGDVLSAADRIFSALNIDLVETVLY